MKILGIHYGHDSSACLIIDNEIVCAISEERLTRVKNDSSFPFNAIKFCLSYASIESEQIDVISLPSLSHTLEFEAFFDLSNLPGRKKLPFKQKIKSYLSREFIGHGGLPLYIEPFKLSSSCLIEYVGHHLSHASSAYFTMDKVSDGPSLIVTMDGRGEGISVGIWKGESNTISLLKSFSGEASLGWIYGIATEGLGWRHGSDEWKVMGLAPYGKRIKGLFDDFMPKFSGGNLVKPYNYPPFHILKDHGSQHWHNPDSFKMSQFLKDVSKEDYAAEIQASVEDSAIELILPWIKKLGTRSFCCAGGCFLNIKLNQKIWETGLLDEHWIFPDAGDAGLSTGAALYANAKRSIDNSPSGIPSMYLGPSFTDDDIETVLRDRRLAYRKSENVPKDTAVLLSKNYTLGWFQGRMELGPRALGARSILMSPLDKKNKDIVNEKIKFRESFRPFCPSILSEHANQYLENYRDERYMTTSFVSTELAEKSIPAVVHHDRTVRPQIVHKEQNELYWNTINEFGKITDAYAVMNTSFNVKGEPIVCSPREAIRCLYDTGLDALVIGSFIVEKEGQ
jgi:carbamoyltransferase